MIPACCRLEGRDDPQLDARMAGVLTLRLMQAYHDGAGGAMGLARSSARSRVTSGFVAWRPGLGFVHGCESRRLP
jgi:hypothetical protein